MEATEKRVSLHVRRLLGTRSGTLALAGGLAVLAAIVLIVFLSQYRDSVRGGTAPATALVAGSLIPKGTSGDVVIGEKRYQSTNISESQLESGAVVDASAIAGKVAVRDVYPGQQLTAADFAAKGDPLRGKLTGDQRAISIPLDTAHGLLGQVKAGDRVDVIGGFTSNGKSTSSTAVVRTLMQNVLVLAAPKTDLAGATDSAKTGNITLRVSDRQAAALAYAADNGKIWFTLRPPAGASEQSPATVDMGSVLNGSN